MSGHSKGPWRVCTSGGYVAGEHFHRNIRVAAPVATIGEAAADARLIESAPDLYAELERLYLAARVMADPGHPCHEQREHIPWGDLVEKASAVLAKAQGGAK